MREVHDILERVRNEHCAETLRRAGQILANLRYGRISDIFAGGLHEYLTAYLDAMQELSTHIQMSFFSPTLSE